jgi:hypothetical protein
MKTALTALSIGLGVCALWTSVVGGESIAIAQTPTYDQINAMSCEEHRQMGEIEGNNYFQQIYNEHGEDAAMRWIGKAGECALSTVEQTLTPPPKPATLEQLQQMSCEEIEAIFKDGYSIATWNFGPEWELWVERYDVCSPGSVIRVND